MDLSVAAQMKMQTAGIIVVDLVQEAQGTKICTSSTSA